MKAVAHPQRKRIYSIFCSIICRCVSIPIYLTGTVRRSKNKTFRTDWLDFFFPHQILF